MPEDWLSSFPPSFVPSFLPSFVHSFFGRLLTKTDKTQRYGPLPPLEYIGRPPLPTPAVGLGEAHKRQAAALMAGLGKRLAEAAGQ